MALPPLLVPPGAFGQRDSRGVEHCIILDLVLAVYYILRVTYSLMHCSFAIVQGVALGGGLTRPTFR
jgi:hypothetical protein